MSWHAELEAYLRREANPPYKYAHQPRLYALASEIAVGEGLIFDDDVVFAAAFLHDLGVFIGHRPEDAAALKTWDHIAYVRDLAPAQLTRFGFPAEKIAHVITCVEEHMPQHQPRSIEATLLRDADILEQLGAIGILRTAAKLASDTRFHQFSDVRISLRHALRELPGKLTLGTAKKLAEPRIASLQGFLDALDAEAGEHLD